MYAICFHNSDNTSRKIVIGYKSKRHAEKTLKSQGFGRVGKQHWRLTIFDIIHPENGKVRVHKWHKNAIIAKVEAA